MRTGCWVGRRREHRGLNRVAASEARAWAESYKALLDDEGSTAPGEISGQAADDHADHPLIASCLRVLAHRAESARDSGTAFRDALANTWVTTVSSGYCATDARPVGTQTAILVDRGLIRALEAAAALIGQHYEGPEFSVGACTAEERAAFARAHTTFLGQYFLYGRASTALGVRSRDPRVDTRVLKEALTFVLAHEIGHVIAGHTPSGDNLSWIAPENIPAGLHAFAAEIEADALAAQLQLGDLWNQRVGRSEVEARLFAIRSVLLTFETVEASALVPVNRRHLPAKRRWDGLLNALTRRFDSATLRHHEELWEAVAPQLRFAAATEVEPPRDSVTEALRHAGWTGAGAGASAWSHWDELEAAVWHYRLPLEIVEALVGYEAGLLLDPMHEMGPESCRLGGIAVSELIAQLPRWLRGSDSSRGSASSGDLIAHLRRRSAWPEPFRSATEGVLPLHTMASAVRHVLAGQQPSGV